jgi:ABC-type nitrate/sulfonate/bicarbonate transport system substrate-binding protein
MPTTINAMRRLFLTVSCAGLLTGVALPALAQGKPADVGKATLGWTKTTAALSVIVAEKLAPKYGLKIENVTFNNAVDVTTGMVSGQIDVGLLTTAHLVRAVATNLDFVEIAGNSRGNVTIIASTKLGLQPGDWKGLKEATQKKKLRIASSRGSINELLSMATFSKFGLDVNKEFELTNIAAFAQHAQALRSGEFDLVFSTEPNGTQMADEGIGLLFSKTDMTDAGSVHTVFAVQREWLAKNRDKARALLLTLKEATDWLNADAARTAAEAAKSFPLKPETLQASLKLNRWDLHLAVPETQALARIAAEQKFESTDVSAKMAAAMDGSLLKEIGVL